MLRIRDVLLLVQIRILGSVSLTNGSGFGSDSRSCYFCVDLQDSNNKNFLSFFTYYFLKLHLHHLLFSKVKSHTEFVALQHGIFEVEFQLEDGISDQEAIRLIGRFGPHLGKNYIRPSFK